MRLFPLALATVASAIPLTVKVPASEVRCFYGEVFDSGTKVGFSYSVQSGGAFDIDFTLKDPNQNVLFERNKESYGEYLFSARNIGEYQFCFSNDMSTFTDKMVEFDLNMDSDLKASLPEPVDSANTDSVEHSISVLEERVSVLLRNLQYYKTRNNRNESTVKSTESRIFYFSMFGLSLMVGMGLLQVVIVQLFFQGSRKQLV